MSNLYLSRFLSTFRKICIIQKWNIHTRMTLMIRVNKEIMRFKLMESDEVWKWGG